MFLVSIAHTDTGWCFAPCSAHNLKGQWVLLVFRYDQVGCRDAMRFFMSQHMQSGSGQNEQAAASAGCCECVSFLWWSVLRCAWALTATRLAVSHKHLCAFVLALVLVWFVAMCACSGCLPWRVSFGKACLFCLVLHIFMASQAMLAMHPGQCFSIHCSQAVWHVLQAVCYVLGKVLPKALELLGGFTAGSCCPSCVVSGIICFLPSCPHIHASGSS